MLPQPLMHSNLTASSPQWISSNTPDRSGASCVDQSGGIIAPTNLSTWMFGTYGAMTLPQRSGREEVCAHPQAVAMIWGPVPRIIHFRWQPHPGWAVES